MIATKIYIISNHLMFSRGLESLLSQRKNLVIVGQEARIEQAIAQIIELEPDVVLLDSTESEESSASKIIRILKIIPSIKVIGLSLQNNKFYIFRASQWAAERVENLIAAIENQSILTEIESK